MTNINFLPTISFYFFIFIFTHNQEKGYEKENDQQREQCFNLLTNSFQFSSNNIDTQSRVKVMRTIKMTTKEKIL